MAKFQGGLKEAAKMLGGLTREAQKKILSVIAKKDPLMATQLEKSLYGFDDIRFLSSAQYMELIREIKISDLALALRMGTPQLKDFVFKNSPRGIRQEIEEVLLGPPRLASQITEAEERVMSVFLRKIDKGELVINRHETEV